MLQRFFHFVIGEPSGCFAGPPADLARQIWDLMEAHRTRRKYARHRTKAAWVDLVHAPARRNENDPSRGPSSP